MARFCKRFRPPRPRAPAGRAKLRLVRCNIAPPPRGAAAPTGVLSPAVGPPWAPRRFRGRIHIAIAAVFSCGRVGSLGPVPRDPTGAHQGCRPLSKVGKRFNGPFAPSCRAERARSASGSRAPRAAPREAAPVKRRLARTARSDWDKGDCHHWPDWSRPKMTQKGQGPFWVISRDGTDHRSGLAASGARRARDAADPNARRAARSRAQLGVRAHLARPASAAPPPSSPT